MAVKETRREGSKKREKGSRKEGRQSEKRARPGREEGRTERFPRNRRVAAEAERRVADGEDWGGRLGQFLQTLVAGVA